MKKYDVIIIGGGAAGLMAAGQAAKLGAKTLLLEKMERTGKKILITGKGRCNLTNIAALSEFVKKFEPNTHYLKKVLSHFFHQNLIDFLNEIGVQTEHERGGRVFPASGNSYEIVEAMIKWLKKLDVKVQTHSKVNSLITDEKKVIGVNLARKGYESQDKELTTFYGDAVIVATGGASYPKTGSTGDGYNLAKSVGHSVKEIYPALVPLVTSEIIPKSLEGLSLRNVEANVWINDKKQFSKFGELEFTETGLSGPIILSLSRKIVKLLVKNNKIVFSFDLKPALDENKLDKRILRDLDTYGRLKFKDILKKLLPVKLIPLCIEQTLIPESKLGNQITTKERKKLRTWLKDIRFEISGNRPFSEAIITQGGIDLSEVNPHTMESKLIENLYFAGEILDIDAETGGYNLQAAFSMGWIAGNNCFNKN